VRADMTIFKIIGGTIITGVELSATTRSRFEKYVKGDKQTCQKNRMLVDFNLSTLLSLNAALRLRKKQADLGQCNIFVVQIFLGIYVKQFA
jgi:hypothetical protein